MACSNAQETFFTDKPAYALLPGHGVIAPNPPPAIRLAAPHARA